MAKAPIDRILKPVHKFIHQEFTGGIILFVSVLVAIVWANSAWKASYHHLWDSNLGINFSGSGLDKPLHVWINDGLMAIFFFVIGLELKREFMAGELSSFKKAILPMVAALGGMLVPALVYALINFGEPSVNGWGIPMATDIAFALALLSLAGKHIPASLKVFLSALAVADDLGAVLVIAFFYTAKIAFFPLFCGFLLLIILVGGNRLGIRNSLFYLLLGIVVWGCFLFSGVHATIAGVLVAFTIPARTRLNEEEFTREVRAYTDKFENACRIESTLTTQEQHANIEAIQQLCLDATTPLQKIEYALHPWVAFVIMPLFALANAGIQIDGSFWSALQNPVSVGVIGGLILGKFIGVMLAVWLMIKTGGAALPYGAKWSQVAGVAVLTGVGFTMSLFVTELAFDDPALIDHSKYGILLASLITGITGTIILRKKAVGS